MTLLIYTNFPKKYNIRKEFKRHKLSNYELYEGRPRKMIEFAMFAKKALEKKQE